MQKITPFLWFDSNALEAAELRRGMEAMLQMIKLDTAKLQQAYDGEAA